MFMKEFLNKILGAQENFIRIFEEIPGRNRRMNWWRNSWMLTERILLKISERISRRFSSKIPEFQMLFKQDFLHRLLEKMLEKVEFLNKLHEWNIERFFKESVEKFLEEFMDDFFFLETPWWNISRNIFCFSLKRLRVKVKEVYCAIL